MSFNPLKLCFYGFFSFAKVNYVVDCNNVKLTICLWSLLMHLVTIHGLSWIIIFYLTKSINVPDSIFWYLWMHVTFGVIIWHILLTSKLVIAYQITWLFNSSLFTCKCSCRRASKRIFPHWTFLPYQNEETLIFERFWSLPIFLTRLSETRVTYLVPPFPVVLGGNSNRWNWYIYMHGIVKASMTTVMEKKELCCTCFIYTYSFEEAYFLDEMSHSWYSSCLPNGLCIQKEWGDLTWVCHERKVL